MATFLALPAEIRNIIYTDYFEDYVTHQGKFGINRRGPERSHGPALLFTCHQIQIESAKIGVVSAESKIGEWDKERELWQNDQKHWRARICSDEGDEDENFEMLKCAYDLTKEVENIQGRLAELEEQLRGYLEPKSSACLIAMVEILNARKKDASALSSEEHETSTG